MHTFKEENREIEKLINDRIKPDNEAFKNADSRENAMKLMEGLNLLMDIDKHYSRKENLLFPMCLETLTEDEWLTIADESEEIGYCLTQPKGKWVPDRTGTAAIIGRTVQNCHPPASAHIVEKMIEDFKAARKDHEDFWIKMGEKRLMSE